MSSSHLNRELTITPAVPWRMANDPKGHGTLDLGMGSDINDISLHDLYMTHLRHMAPLYYMFRLSICYALLPVLSPVRSDGLVQSCCATTI